MGLGNPGVAYDSTYHNLGFEAIQYVKNKIDEEAPWQKDSALFGSYAKTQNIIFVKPETYMNKSGMAAKAALKKFHANPEALIVIHDESDLRVGEFKLSFNRGAAGHHGIESIINSLGTKEFWRLRIGFQPQEKKRMPASELVLKKIKPADKKTLKAVYEEVAQAIAKFTKNE